MRTRESNEEALMTPEEVAALLRVKPATVYEAAARGRLPVVRLWRGQRRSLVRFRRSEIQELIHERTEPARHREQ